jgi:hypothetical protein
MTFPILNKPIHFTVVGRVRYTTFAYRKFSLRGQGGGRGAAKELD